MFFDILLSFSSLLESSEFVEEVELEEIEEEDEVNEDDEDEREEDELESLLFIRFLFVKDSHFLTFLFALKFLLDAFCFSMLISTILA